MIRKFCLLFAGLAMIAGGAAGCMPKQAPTVAPPQIAKNSTAAQIQANPDLTPQEKQNVLEGMAHPRPNAPTRGPDEAPK